MKINKVTMQPHFSSPMIREMTCEEFQLAKEARIKKEAEKIALLYR